MATTFKADLGNELRIIRKNQCRNLVDMENARKKVMKRHAFKSIKSNQKMIHAKLKICRKDLEKNLNCYVPNAAFCMHVKHPFIDKVN